MTSHPSNICLVTSLYDLHRGEMNNSFSRSFDHYKECFFRLLKVEYPMVIFCDPSLNADIWKHRDISNTTIINKTLEEFKTWFPFYNEVQKIRTDPKWFNQMGWLAESPQAKLEYYDVLVMSKMFMLNDASLAYGRDYKHFMWVDAGISNTIGDPCQWFDKDFGKKIASKMKNKMLFLTYPYDKNSTEVHGFTRAGMNRFAGKETEYVCRGGLFGGGSPDVIHEWNDLYYGILSETLKSGLMGTEESVQTILSYQHPEKCNLEPIESNGLIVTFLDRLKKEEVEPEPEFPLAFYVLTYNTPSEFKKFVQSFIKAYPEDFKNNKKYVIDNSTDEKCKVEYRKMFSEYGFEIIHEGSNIGIQDGRQLAAKHFDESDHKWSIFAEEDFEFITEDNPMKNNQGFVTYVPDIFNKMIHIMEDNEFDYLKMTTIGFFGHLDHDWSFKNLPQNKREEYFPVRSDGNEDLRWKTKINYIGMYKDLAYASGHRHIDNWMTLLNKKGNKQIYLEIQYEHPYEATTMSQAKMFMMEGKLYGGMLLAAPIIHSRKAFYATKRKENHYYPD